MPKEGQSFLNEISWLKKRKKRKKESEREKKSAIFFNITFSL